MSNNTTSNNTSIESIVESLSSSSTQSTLTEETLQVTQNQRNFIEIEAGSNHRIATEGGHAEGLLDHVVAIRNGDDLEVILGDGSVEVFKDFYTVCAEGECSVTLPGVDGDYLLTADAVNGVASGADSVVVYAHGDQALLMELVAGNDTLTEALASIEVSEGADYIPQSGLMSGAGMGGLLVVGAALGGGGGSVAANAVSSEVVLNISTLAGPFIDKLTYTIYDDQGNEIAAGTTDGNGNTKVTLSSDYKGKSLLLVLSDQNGSGNDYADELGDVRDLTVDLRAAVVVTEGMNNITVSPLSELAVRIAGVTSNTAPQVELVISSNAQVAEAVGVGNVLGPVVTVNTAAGEENPAFNEANGTSQAELAGGQLAKISGLTARDGLESTLSALVTGIQNDILTPNGQEVEALMAVGAGIFEGASPYKDVATLSEAAFGNPSASNLAAAESVNTEFSDGALTAAELDDGTEIAVAVASGAVIGDTVWINLPATGVGTAQTSDSYTLTKADIINGYALVPVTKQNFADSGQSNDATLTATFTQTSTGNVVDMTVITGLTQIAPGVTITLGDYALSENEITMVTFEFSQAVTGFGMGDIVLDLNNTTLQPLSLATDNSNGTQTYTAYLTPVYGMNDDTNVITVEAKSYTATTGDNAGFLGGAGSSLNYTVDYIAPTVTISLSDAALAKGESTQVTFTFSEKVEGFVLGDIGATVGTLGTLTTTDDQTYTATFTPTAGLEGLGTITVGAGRFQDIAGNFNAVEANAVYTYDETAPILDSIVLSDTLLAKNESTQVTFTFSEKVTGFDIQNAGITIDNGTLSALSSATNNLDGTQTYTATFTPTAESDVTGNISVSAGSYQDIAGNVGTTAISSSEYTIDVTAPTVTVTFLSGDSDPLVGLSGENVSIGIKFEFSEPVTLSADNVVAANGSIQAWSPALPSDPTNLNGPMEITATLIGFLPAGEAGFYDASNVITVQNYTDAAGNVGVIGESGNYRVDAIVPSLTITMDDTNLSAGEETNVTFTFNEKVTGFDIQNVGTTAENGTLGTLSSATNNSDGTQTYTTIFTATSSGNSSGNKITVDYIYGSGFVYNYLDEAGNSGNESSVSPEYTVDIVAPTVSITMDNDDLKAGDTAVVTFIFSEAVTGFVVEDIVTASGTLDTLITTDDQTYTATFTPATDVESIVNVISVTNESYSDVSGNKGSSGDSANYVVDTKAPSVTVTMADSDNVVNADESPVVSFTFSEKVQGFIADDITITGGTLGTLTTTDDQTYTAIFTPTANTDTADNKISVANESYTDIAGNTGSAGESDSYVVDTIAPTVSSITMDNVALKADETAVITFTFSEAVTGFVLGDIDTPNGALGTLSSATIDELTGEATYTATFTPAIDVESTANVISVTNESYTDIAGNKGSAGGSGNYTVDTQRPSISGITLERNSVIVDTFNMADNTSDVTFTFSEAVTLVVTDIDVQSGTLSSLSTADSGLTYTATFTANANVDASSNIITVNPTYTDAAGNTAISSTSSNSYEVDTAPPTVGFFIEGNRILSVGDSTVVHFYFGETVNFSNSNIQVSNGEISTLTTSDGGVSYEATFTQTVNAAPIDPVITVFGYTDAAGNIGNSTDSPSYTVNVINAVVDVSGDTTNSGTSFADVFEWPSGNTGSDTVTGFENSQGDKIDLRGLLDNSTINDVGADVSTFIEVTQDNTNDAVMKVDVNGLSDFVTPEQTITFTNAWDNLGDGVAVTDLINSHVLFI